MSSLVGNSPVFVTTQWTIVMCAGGEHSQAADEALEKLSRAYWYPLYVFIRRSGYAHHDAEDLTQAFFTQILEKRCLSGLDRTKGKFRSYLLAAFQNFASKDRRYTRAQKRGGGCTFVSFDDESVEEMYLNSASVNDSPERAFERQWATTLLANVVARLRAEFYAADKAALFDELKVFLTGEKRVSSYAEIASKSDTTEAALKMAVSRMRHRYGELLREEIANTVSDPTEVDAELRALISALS